MSASAGSGPARSAATTLARGYRELCRTQQVAPSTSDEAASRPPSAGAAETRPDPPPRTGSLWRTTRSFGSAHVVGPQTSAPARWPDARLRPRSGLTGTTGPRRRPTTVTTREDDERGRRRRSRPRPVGRPVRMSRRPLGVGQPLSRPTGGTTSGRVDSTGCTTSRPGRLPGDGPLCPRFGPAEPGQIPRRSPVRPPGPLRSQEISGPGSTDTHLRAGRRDGDRRALRTRLDESDATRPRTWTPSLQPSGGVHEIPIGGSRDSPVATTVLSGELPPELLDPPPAR